MIKKEESNPCEDGENKGWPMSVGDAFGGEENDV